MVEHETIDLTKGKAFQSKFVHRAASEFAWPGWEERELLLVTKVLNKSDFPSIEALLGNWSVFLGVLNDAAAQCLTCGTLWQILYVLPETVEAYDRVPGMIWS